MVPTSLEADSPTPQSSSWSVAALLLFAASVLLLWNLGANPFWGDEADTVLFAENVWKTGDTSAWHGENLYAYRNGTLLSHFKNRATPPLAYYVAAPFFGMFGEDTIGMRLPFALCGLATVGIVLVWLRCAGASTSLTLLVAGSVVFNVSFLLYSRQCRYYALGTFLATATAYVYRFYDGTLRSRLTFVCGLSLLAATQYLNFAAFVAVLGIDYLVWQRKRRSLTRSEWAAIVAPTLALVFVLAYVYNPLERHNTQFTEPRNWLADKLMLLGWTLRDLNRCEYGVGPAMLLAPLVGLWRRDPKLLRLFVGGCAFVLTTTLLSPQAIDKNVVDADVRYLAPLAVLGPVLTALTLYALVGRRAVPAALLVALTLFTNVLHLPWDHTEWRSTLGEYIYELRNPRHTATAALSTWLNENVQPGSTVWLTPNEWLAPQILLAPDVRYAWQLKEPTSPDFADLPPWHFYRRVPVDVIVVLAEGELKNLQENILPKLESQGWTYDFATTLDVFHEDRTRPELIWHWFRDRTYDKSHGIHIFRRRLIHE